MCGNTAHSSTVLSVSYRRMRTFASGAAMNEDSKQQSDAAIDHESAAINQGQKPDTEGKAEGLTVPGVSDQPILLPGHGWQKGVGTDMI